MLIAYCEKCKCTNPVKFPWLHINFGAKNTWWDALNSVTYLTDHKMGRESDSRMASAWFGRNQTRKIKAVEKAVEYAEAA